ncbi:MAG TPA: iron-containing alcohol dehydrogenase, partial [Candidatus Latescibacteria bacterium]|nr:iron-containing alcohol dehydrogenase [Candidatus Latescibacterota bacterium]
MKKDIAFEMATSSIRFGHGVTREAGMDLVDMGVNRVMVITDPTLSALPPVATLLESLAGNGVAYELFDRVHVEPTDASFQEAIAFAREGEFDGFVAIGGGSSIDTAKAANLYATYP